MKILLVEDDVRVARAIVKELTYQRHLVEAVTDGVSGWEYARSGEFDLVLLDLMLPQLDGISLCRKLRTLPHPMLIMMLTARDTLADRVLGLDSGADDYLVKPFSLEELSARVRALARRSSDFKASVLVISDLCLDATTNQVFYQQSSITLTPKEFQLLEYLMRHPNHVFSRSELLNRLWSLDEETSENTIKTHLGNLRQKLRLAGCPNDLIETVHGFGYRLVSPS